MGLEGMQVDVADDDQLVQRVAAIDVAKASGMVCTRVPNETTPGKRVSRVWQVAATTNAILGLAEELASEGIERVVLQVWLVNARDVKNVPGRPKTDKLDAIWLAKLNERGMLRPSFIPPVQIRRLRDFTRLRLDLTTERSRHVQRLEKLLEDALIKISIVATDIMGVSGRAMIEALIAGQRNPLVPADLASGRQRVKHAALVQPLTGRFDDHHGELARVLLDQVDTLTGQIEHLSTRIEEMIAAIPAARYVDLGPDFHDNHVNAQRSKRNHIRQLEALGYTVTLAPAA